MIPFDRWNAVTYDDSFLYHFAMMYFVARTILGQPSTLSRSLLIWFELLELHELVDHSSYARDIQIRCSPKINNATELNPRQEPCVLKKLKNGR